MPVQQQGEAGSVEAQPVSLAELHSARDSCLTWDRSLQLTRRTSADS